MLTVERLIERFPHYSFRIFRDPNHCQWSGVRSTVVDFVDSDVGEEGGAGRNPTSRQSASRGHKKPMIDVGNNTDEKWVHCVHITNGVVALACEINKVSIGFAIVHGVDERFDLRTQDSFSSNSVSINAPNNPASTIPSITGECRAFGAAYSVGLS